MVIKTNLRKVISYVVTLAMIVSVMAGLDFGVITAEATNYSKQTWYITTGDDGTIQSVNFQFITSDTAPGTWRLYLWDKNDTSGTNGRPQILSSASKTTSDGEHSLTINYDGSHGKEYLIGMVLEGSRWSTENTSGSEYSDWPYLTSVCDMVDCDDEELAGDVYINGESVSGSVSDSLKTEGITINFASAGGTTGTMDSVTLSAEAEIYTLPEPTFTPNTNRDFYLWEVVKEDGTIVGVYPSNQNIKLSGDSKAYTATAYYGYTATITGNIGDDDVTFISETMVTGKQLLSPEFSSSPNPNLAEGNGIIINTTLSPAPQITATNATITLYSSNEDDGTYTYFYLATNITGPVTATVTAAEGGEEEEEDTPTGATYTFSYAYDCQRSPAFPKKGDKVILDGFIGPYINNSSDNSAIDVGWSLVSDGKYDSTTHTKLSNLVTNLNDYGYEVDAADMEVYKLVRKDTNAVVAIGFIFTTMGSDGLLYISSNDYGYYICDKALTNTDTITVTADGDISDPAIPGGSTGEEDFTSDTVLMEGFTTSVDEETGVITISNIFAKNGGKLYYDVMSFPDLPESDVDMLNAEISENISPENVFVDKLEEIDGNSVTITMTENAPYVVILCEVHDINVIEDSNGVSKFASRVINLYFANGNDSAGEEVPTYTVKLDASKFTGSYIIGYGDDINGDQQYLKSGGTIEIPTDGTVTISATEAFTAAADGATVGELKEGEGLFRIISNFTKDTTIVINPDPSEEETTYNVKLDCTNYTETRVDLYTYDSEQNTLEYISTNGDTITVPETGFARVFVYGGEFTVTAEGATVGELIDAGDEGSYREITDFTKDTTVVVNAAVPHVCKFGEWEITTPATATADGVKTRKCECGETETAVVKFVPAADEDTGTLTEDTNAAENECNADIAIEAEDIITDIGLESEEIKAIENGEDISIYLEVNNADATVSAEDKSATEAVLTEGMKIGMHLDINLFKKIGDNAAKNITSTLKPVKIIFKVPDRLIKNGRIFSIVRVHNGKTDILSCDFDAATKTASFETDKFSSYAIAYKDNANDGGNTGGNPVIPNIPVITGTPTTTPVTTTTATTTTSSTTTTPAEDDEIEEDVEEDIEIDDDTDTTKPADDEDEADGDVDSDDDAEDSDVDGDKNETDNETDDNPETGVAVGLAGVLVAGAAVLLFGKRK